MNEKLTEMIREWIEMARDGIAPNDEQINEMEKKLEELK